MKKLIKQSALFICLMLIAFCCLSQKKSKTEVSPITPVISENSKGYFSQVFGYNVPEIFNPALYDTIADWLGTPYCYSGKNGNGIDCSGFVNMIYLNVFGISLNGNSAALYKSSHHCSIKKLKEGDLVFFKIHHRKVSHVGLYLGGNKFVHSSTSNGVIISDLDEPYYKKHFAGGGSVE